MKNFYKEIQNIDNKADKIHLYFVTMIVASLFVIMAILATYLTMKMNDINEKIEDVLINQELNNDFN